MHYILDDQGNVEPAELLEWAKWFETANRILDKTKIGDVEVSTVFLGINYNFYGGTPLLWETMIFGGEHDQYQDRYSSKEDALKGHQVAIDLVMSSLHPACETQPLDVRPSRKMRGFHNG